MTSHDVVNRLRRITGEESIGHLGTLDPMATGVLPLLMGRFTRLAQYFSAAEKSYTGAIRFGFATDTYDADGEPAGPDQWPEAAQGLTLERVRAVGERFRGEMEQMPPPFSAKKIGGKPAYKLAREGKPVVLKPAKVRIDAFEIVAMEGAEANFTIDISSGGYVRSVAHELGQDLECGAHLSRLRRTRAGAFTLADAHSLEELEAVAENAEGMEAFCVHTRTGQVAQRGAGQSAGVLHGPTGEGLCRAARSGCHRPKGCRHAVSAGRGDGVAPGFRDQVSGVSFRRRHGARDLSENRRFTSAR